MRTVSSSDEPGRAGTDVAAKVTNNAAVALSPGGIGVGAGVGSDGDFVRVSLVRCVGVNGRLCVGAGVMVAVPLGVPLLAVTVSVGGGVIVGVSTECERVGVRLSVRDADRDNDRVRELDAVVEIVWDRVRVGD